jgi:alpha-D-xyloside xylohydrolase
VYHDTFTTEPDEHFYGFGEKFSGLDKRGQQLEMWNYDSYGAHTERAYKNVPFFMSSRGYAVFVDSVTHVNFLWRPPTTLPSASWSPTPRSTTT